MIKVSKQAIRSITRDESSYLVVFGPSGGEKWASDDRHLAELVARRKRVDRAVGDFCKARHVD